MQTYTAPLRDMRFVLHELHGSASLTHLPGLEEITPDLLNTILEEAAKFISSETVKWRDIITKAGIPVIQ